MCMLQFDALREVLADNRGQLVAQNMLKEGHTKEEAEKRDRRIVGVGRLVRSTFESRWTQRKANCD